MVQLKKEITLKMETINTSIERAQIKSNKYFEILADACKVYGVEITGKHIGACTMVTLIESVDDGRRRDELAEAFELYNTSKTLEAVFELIKKEEILL